MIKRSLLILILFAATALAQEPPPQRPVPTQVQPAGRFTTNEEFAKAVIFGKRFFDLKQYAASYEQFLKADSLMPDQSAVLYDMALVLAKAGRYSEAQGKVDRYLQLFPSGAERSLITHLQIDLEFQRELQKTRQADQSYAELFTRGNFSYSKNDLEGALKLYQQAEQQRPTDPAAVFNQAVVYEKLGDLTRAVERFQRYEELEQEPEAKIAIGQRILALETELEDMRTKIVCSFCGYKLPIGSTWCHRCWHGTYLTASPVWNTRPCVEGASATRSTYYSDNRFAKNDSLACMFGVTMLETLRYNPAKQRSIQEARKGEGWTYNGDIIQGWSDKQGNQIRFHQGADYLEKITASTGGEILPYAAHKAGDVWLLDREETIIDGIKYSIRYAFDASNHIAQQHVEYQNIAACNHLIAITADYAYQNDALVSVKLTGGYEGFLPEGAPKVTWQAAVAYTYDSNARVVKEDLAVTSYEKIYMQKPIGAWRNEVGKLYAAGVRAHRPIENFTRTGDYCATVGNLLLANPIDLRPFYAMSPNLAIALPAGVVHATVSFTYPDSYRVR